MLQTEEKIARGGRRGGRGDSGNATDAVADAGREGGLGTVANGSGRGGRRGGRCGSGFATHASLLQDVEVAQQVVVQVDAVVVEGIDEDGMIMEVRLASHRTGTRREIGRVRSDSHQCIEWDRAPWKRVGSTHG